MIESESAVFKVWCIDEYASKHSMTVPDTIDLFDRYGVFRFLDNPAVRWQSLDNAIFDIEEFIYSRS